MSKSIRSFSDFQNSDEFKFTIKEGKMIFGRIFNNQNSRIRFWKGIVELSTIDITADMIDINNFNSMNNSQNLFTTIYSIYGLIDGKVTISDKTYIRQGKNIGKSNETTVLTQAMIQIRALYLKKINSGYNEIITESNNIPFVMALQSYEKMKKKILYPCYIQPKLDGIRLMSNMNLSNNKINMLSRRHKLLFGFENIETELKILFQFTNINSDLYIDGELYKHGMQLQNISSIVRQEDAIIEKNELQYHIFDCFSPSQTQLTFEDRYLILKHIFDNNNFKYLVLVKTNLIISEQVGDELNISFVKNNYEGSVYKNKNAIYEFSYDKEKRSQQYLKRKKSFENEFKVVGFTQGDKGKGVGSIIFILETDDGKQFRSTPKMTLEERSRLYKDSLINFDSKYKNKMGTIRYDNVSNDGIPLRSNFITFRDYE